MKINKKLNICFPFVGDSLGGSHFSTLDIIKNLNKKFFNPIIILHKKGILYNYLKQNNIIFSYIPIRDFAGKKKGIIINLKILILNFFKINRFIKNNNIEIVHSNDVSIHFNWVIPTKLSDSKFLWHLRTKFPNWNLYKFLISYSDKIVCISKYVRKTLPRRFYNNSSVIYNPIILNKRIIKQSEKKIISKLSKIKKKKILFFSNIIESKKVDIFIKAAINIYKNNDDFIFLIIGRDKFNIFKKIFSKINDNEFKRKLFYLGDCYNIKYWFKSSSLLISPAINEGHNRVIVESMLSKLPVIASNSGGHKESIINNKSGWLFKSGDYKNLSKLILNFFKLKKSEIKKIKGCAYKNSLKNFNINQSLFKIEKLYKEILIKKT